MSGSIKYFAVKFLMAIPIIMVVILFATVTGNKNTFAKEAVSFEYNTFKLVPVYHEGRIKPLDTYARLKLKHISGQERFSEQDAIAWMAEIFFDPARAAKKQVIKIPDPIVKSALGLSEPQDMFSVIEIETALPKLFELAQEEKSLDTSAQKEKLLKTYNQIIEIFDLMRAFSGLPLVENNGSEQLAHILKAGGAESNEPRLIFYEGEWISPWQYILNAQEKSEEPKLLINWLKSDKSFKNNDYNAWKEAIFRINSDLDRTTKLRLKAEIFYNNYKPFRWASILYGAVFLMLGGGILFLNKGESKVAYNAVWAVGALALLAHFMGIVMRVHILSRPPVGTLFESLLFVSFIVAFIGFLKGLKAKRHIYALLGFGCAVFLLCLAPMFAVRGDDMEVLVAVLDTNFWLMVHVLCITSGYGAAVMAAMIAHSYLYLLGKNSSLNSQEGIVLPTANLYRSLYNMSLLALFLTAFGTALGGVWADQSWGRFWGWDPKENGALLIVLWLIWALHGKYGGQLSQITFATCIALLNIIVALAWFGVNLLGVGLHSYGFTNALAGGLGAFCMVEAIIILGLTIRASRNRKEVQS